MQITETLILLYFKELNAYGIMVSSYGIYIVFIDSLCVF